MPQAIPGERLTGLARRPFDRLRFGCFDGFCRRLFGAGAQAQFDFYFFDVGIKVGSGSGVGFLADQAILGVQVVQCPAQKAEQGQFVGGGVKSGGRGGVGQTISQSADALPSFLGSSLHRLGTRPAVIYPGGQFSQEFLQTGNLPPRLSGNGRREGWQS